MKHELLAPAGSYPICEAVIAAGADAVYLGGEKFSARAQAPNFSEQEVLEALDLAHLHDRKIYLALNTLLKNREMDRELYQYIKPFYEHGLDAIIVQDYGVFQFVKRYFPELPIHISTQMYITGAYGAEFLRERGAKRVVAARELTLAEIRDIHEKSDIEIECFVHGALCYCYSGQCLMSSLIGGRSGNRGRCAQPCRLPYQVQDGKGNIIGDETGYPLSLKDLCAAELIPQLCEAGVYSFKIEGRMKSLAYAAGVTRIYREYLDLYESDPEHFFVSAKDEKKLLAYGNRSGFTEGYYVNTDCGSMLTRRDSSHTSREADETYDPEDMPKIPIKGVVSLSPGSPLTLTATSHTGVTVTVSKDPVQEAKNRPLTVADIRSQMGKTGDTPFFFDALEVEMKGECFVPIGQLNELRRETLSDLENCCLQSKRRMATVSAPQTGSRTQTSGAESAAFPVLNVIVSTNEQLEEVQKCDFVDCVTLDPDAFPRYFDEKGLFSDTDYLHDLAISRRRIAASGKKTGFCFPYVFRKDTAAVFEQDEWMDLLRTFDTLWVRSFDSLGYCLIKLGIDPGRIRLDAGVHVFSEEAWHDFALEGIGGYTASFEQNGKELSHMPNQRSQMAIYGYLPVMVSAQCVYRNYAECIKLSGKNSRFYLSDRFSHLFFVKTNCANCYNVIYNSRPLSLFHRAREIKDMGFDSLRISLISENGPQTAAILDDYRRSFLRGEEIDAPGDETSYTNGHFRRGVE